MEQAVRGGRGWVGRERRGRGERGGEGSSGPEPGAPLSRYEPHLWLPAGSHLGVIQRLCASVSLHI